MKKPASHLIVFAAAALIIGVFGLIPVQAHAQYYYDSVYDYSGYTPTIYGQGYSTPVYGSYSSPVYSTWYTPTYSSYSYPTCTTNCYTYNYPYNYNYSYANPYYNSYNNYYPVYYNQPLSVSCSPAVSTADAGTPVTWSATAIGGPGNYWGSNGNYTFTWSGESIIPRNSNLATAYYTTPGIKTATVTVYSGGQVITKNCGSVSVTSKYLPPPWGY